LSMYFCAVSTACCTCKWFSSMLCIFVSSLPAKATANPQYRHVKTASSWLGGIGAPHLGQLVMISLEGGVCCVCCGTSIFSSEGGCSLLSSIVPLSFGGLNRAAKCDTFYFEVLLAGKVKCFLLILRIQFFPFEVASLQKCYIQGIQKDGIVMYIDWYSKD